MSRGRNKDRGREAMWAAVWGLAIKCYALLQTKVCCGEGLKRGWIAKVAVHACSCMCHLS